ncbi:MAG: hypothetical protein P8K78_09465 [Pirellulales bacterium]|nr:hypothetical protein [Pirellulales bacterium]
MNGNLTSRPHTLLCILAVALISQFSAVTLHARDLVWQPHPAAGQTVQPRKFAGSVDKRLGDAATISPQDAGPAIVALGQANEEASSLEPIPVANYRSASTNNKSGQQAIQASYGPRVYPEQNYPAPGAVVQPWHPDSLYAGSGAGLRLAQRTDASVLTPEPITAEAITPQPAGPEEILPEDLGPGEILIPDGTDPMDVGAFSQECCSDCGGTPCQCDPDWGYPLPDCAFPCFPFLRPTLEFVDFSVGAESFAGPADMGVNSNFGFNEKVNLSGSWLGGWVGWQIGARFIQADLNGMRVNINPTTTSTVGWKSDIRHQEFLTLGLFHRATEYQPWQGGVAIDFMEDHFYYKTDLTQLRFEVSRRFWCRLDFGTWIVLHADKEVQVVEHRLQGPSFAEYQASDQYTLFLQWAFPNGGQARLYGGGGDNRDGIIGGNFWTPLSHSMTVEGNFGYLFSGKDGSVGPGLPVNARPTRKSLYDAYGVSVNIAWYPHCRARVSSRSAYRALFPVANNGTFFVNRHRDF